MPGDQRCEHRYGQGTLLSNAEWTEKWKRDIPCRSLSKRDIPESGRPACSRTLPKFPKFLNGGSPLRCTACITQPSEYMSEAVFKTSSRAYSGAAAVMSA